MRRRKRRKRERGARQDWRERKGEKGRELYKTETNTLIYQVLANAVGVEYIAEFHHARYKTNKV